MKGQKTELRAGVWRLRAYVGRSPKGSPVYLSETFHGGSRAADDALADLVRRARQGSTVEAARMTFGDLLDAWLDHLKSQGRSPTTLQGYGRVIDRTLRPQLGHLKLTGGRGLTTRHLDALYADLTARGLAPASVRRVHACASGALRQAERWGIVERSVARNATPPVEHRQPAQVPTPDEVRTLIGAAEAADPTLASLLMLAALTGARRGELCGLQWPDVDFEHGVLTIARSVYETAGGGWALKPPKTHAARRVALDAVALAVLRHRRTLVEKIAADLGLDVLPDGFVFSRSPVGRTPLLPGHVTKAARRIAEKAGVDVHPHLLRHFSATQMIGAGVDVRTAAARLGHADPSVTLRVYAHALEQRDREAAAQLGRTLAPQLAGGDEEEGPENDGLAGVPALPRP